LVMAPCRRRSPVEYSEGMRPKNFMSALGGSKRVRSPSSATVVTATVHWPPRRAWRASTTGVEAPGVDPLVEFLCETPQAFSVFGHGADRCLKDNVLRWCGANHLREPPEMGRVPGGLARVPDVVPEQKGFKPGRGTRRPLAPHTAYLPPVSRAPFARYDPRQEPAAVGPHAGNWAGGVG
jgi:hypothetical protein